MNYFYNVSHSQAKTATNFKIGKTTVRQWKQEDEGKRIIKAKRDLYNENFSKEMFASINVEESINTIIKDGTNISFEINGYKLDETKWQIRFHDKMKPKR